MKFVFEHPFLCLAAAVLIFWLVSQLVFFTHLIRAKLNFELQVQQVPVSIVIAAKNEFENLKKHLPLWLNQDHTEFEIVVVNDRSWDKTERLLKKFAEQDARITFTSIPEATTGFTGKKLALTMGIKKAKYDYIFLTDADCYPNTPSLIKQVSAVFTQKNDLVLGFAPLSGTGLLAGLQKVENFLTAYHYLNFAAKGKPYMGVGRFMGFTKELFFSVGGYKKHNHLAYGDDDLFVQTLPKSVNTGIVNPKFQVESAAVSTLGAYFKQRKRHFSAAKYYSASAKFYAGHVNVLNLFFIVFITGAFFQSGIFFPGILLGARLLFGMILGIINGVKLKKQTLSMFLPFWEGLVLIIQAFVYLAAVVKPAKRW